MIELNTAELKTAFLTTHILSADEFWKGQEIPLDPFLAYRPISVWFLNVLGNLRSPQLTGSCITLSRYSKRARRKTMKTIGQSVSLQWLLRYREDYSGRCWEAPGRQLHQRFTRGKSCLSNQISLYDKVTHLTDQRKPAGVTFLDFCKAFNALSDNIFMDKMSSTQMGKHITGRDVTDSWVRHKEWQ